MFLYRMFFVNVSLYKWTLGTALLVDTDWHFIFFFLPVCLQRQPVRRRYESYDSDDNASETSSVCSERSFSSSYGKTSEVSLFHVWKFSCKFWDILTSHRDSQVLINFSAKTLHWVLLKEVDSDAFLNTVNTLFWPQ